MNNKNSTKDINSLLIGLTAGFVLLGVTLFVFRKQIKQGAKDIVRYVFTADQERFLKELHPSVVKDFRSFIKDVDNKLGYLVRINSGYRSFKKQQEMVDSGNYPVIAKSGYSSHNFGMALDISLINKKNANIISQNSPISEWKKTGVVNLARSKYGMRWGGDGLDGISGDPVHFDMMKKYNINKLRELTLKQYGSIENAKGNRVNLA